MTELGAWKTAIWEELSTLDPEEQFVVAGEWCTSSNVRPRRLLSPSPKWPQSQRSR